MSNQHVELLDLYLSGPARGVIRGEIHTRLGVEAMRRQRAQAQAAEADLSVVAGYAAVPAIRLGGLDEYREDIHDTS